MEGLREKWDDFKTWLYLRRWEKETDEVSVIVMLVAFASLYTAVFVAKDHGLLAWLERSPTVNRVVVVNLEQSGNYDKLTDEEKKIVDRIRQENNLDSIEQGYMLIEQKYDYYHPQ